MPHTPALPHWSTQVSNDGVPTLKKNLLVIFTLVAMGFGARQVFLFAEDWKGRSQITHAPILENPTTQSPVTEVPVVQPQLTEAQITQPPMKESPVTRTADTQPRGDSFYYLLHPDRKDSPENPATDEAQKR